MAWVRFPDGSRRKVERVDKSAAFVSLVADQLDDLVKVADLAGHVATRTTQGYRHPVRSLPHAIEAWDRLLARSSHG